MAGTVTWNDRYRSSHNKWCKRTAPGFYLASGGDEMLVTFPKVTSANGIRKAICNFMKWEGHHMEPTQTMGRPIQKHCQKFSLLSGKLEKVSTGIEWQKGSGIKGSSDCKGHINHKNHKYAIPLYIEIKWNKDKMSDEQFLYQQLINDSGGIYIVVKTIQGFFEWYDIFLSSL